MYIKPLKQNAGAVQDKKTGKKTKPFITEKEIINIFANLEYLLHIHKDFLAELRQQEQLPIKQQSIGNLIMKYAGFFTCYMQYVSNSDLQRRSIEKLMKDSPQFVEFIDNRKHNELQLGLELKSYLIKPLQRFCKYPLLLKPMCEFIPKIPHEPWIMMQQAYSKIKEVIDKVESMMNSMESEKIIPSLTEQGK